MFGLSDLLSLIISAFIILPVVTFLRESGYLITSAIFGVKNPRLSLSYLPRRKWKRKFRSKWSGSRK